MSPQLRPINRHLPRPAVLVAIGSLAIGTLAGCGYRGAESLPLPGGGAGADAYRVSVVFDDAANLATKGSCRANDTVVGEVESVKLTKELQARVVCRIRKDVTLPANAVATLAQTSLLGERYVALDPPAGTAPEGRLKPGATLSASAASTNPDVETVFAAFSQVLNGGSLGSISTITRELNTALRDVDTGQTLQVLQRTVGTLAENRSAITRALDGLDRFSANLADQRTVLGDALESIPAGVAVLNRQRPALVRTLESLDSLSRTARPLIQRSRAATVANLKALQPVLDQLDQASKDLALTIERAGTFPFPTNALAAIKNDYAGFDGTILLDLDLLSSLLIAVQDDSRALGPTGGQGGVQAGNPEKNPLGDLVDLLEGRGESTGGSSGGSSAANPLAGLLGPLFGGSR